MLKENRNRHIKAKDGEIKMVSQLLEKDRVAYINEMLDHVEQIKNMPKDKAKKEALDSLYRAGIVTKKGTFTAHYKKNIEG